MKKYFSLKDDVSPLLKLAIPLALTGLVQSSVWFFETLFLAQLGPDILAAGSLVSWLFGTIIVILFGTLSSINILISHKHGANDHHGISLVLRDGLILAILLSLPAYLLFWNMAPIFLLFGQEPSVVTLAESYLHALSWGLLPDFLMIAILEFIIGIGHARVVMIFSMIAVLFNIGFSYILIFGKFGFPVLGIAGAGWGLTISNCATFLLLIIFVLASKNYRKYFRNIFYFHRPSFLLELTQIGMPIGVMYCFEVAFFFALTLFMGSLGSQMLAANQIALQYLGLLMSMMFAIAQAITVRMGHLLGAKEVHAAKRVNNVGISLSALLMVPAALVYWFAPKMLISLDFDIHDPNNFKLIQYAEQFLAIGAVFQIFEAMRISLFGALRSLKDTRFTLLTSIISFWGISLGLGYLFSRYLELGGAGFWWAMVLGAITSVLLLYFRFQFKTKSFGGL